MKRFLQTTTPDLEASLEHYKRLKFQHVLKDDVHYFSNGKDVFLLNTRKTARPGMVIRSKDLSELKKQVSTITNIIDTDFGFVAACPSGVVTEFHTSEEPLPEFNSNQSMLGNASGLTLETTNIEGSIRFYEATGLKIKSGKASDGFLTMADDNGFEMALLRYGFCPHTFKNPSVSYFNGKEGNPVVIDQVRKSELTIYEEITHFNEAGLVDNIIILDPGGFGSFVFND